MNKIRIIQSEEVILNRRKLREGLERPRDTRPEVTRRRQLVRDRDLTPETEISNFGLETKTMSRDLTSLV